MFRTRHAEDRERLHEKARRLSARGELRKAIAVLRDLAAAAPEDDRTLIKLSDLHRRCGDEAEAVAALSRAAELYAGRGFALKAAAALRQAAAIVPGDLPLLERLGEVNAQLGLAREAARCLNQVTEVVALTGDGPRLIALRRRILELLPGDAGAAVRLADALVAAGERDEAVRLLADAAEARREPAQVELWILIQERLADLRPDDVALAKQLSRVLLERGAPRSALSRLKPCVAAGHRDVDLLSLLAQAFEGLGLAGKAGTAWREIAHAHQRAGLVTEPRAAWEKVLRLLPGDPEATRELAPPEPPPPPGASLEDELAEADFFAGQGLVTEARGLLRVLRERFPAAAVVGERLEALDARTLDAVELLEEDVELVLFEEAARDSTTAVLERVPLDPALRLAESATHRDLAIAFIEMERHEEALRELEAAIAADPFSAEECRALALRVRGSGTVDPWPGRTEEPSPSPASVTASSA